MGHHVQETHRATGLSKLLGHKHCLAPLLRLALMTPHPLSITHKINSSRRYATTEIPVSAFLLVPNSHHRGILSSSSSLPLLYSIFPITTTLQRVPEVRTPSNTDLQFATCRKELYSTTFIHKITSTQPKIILNPSHCNQHLHQD